MDKMGYIFKVVRVEYQEQWLSIYSNVAMVFESLKNIMKMGNIIIVSRIFLFADHLVATIVLPCSCFPVMVCPCQAERKVWLAGI